MSTVRVPGVRVIELASSMRPMADLSRVRTVTMPGLTGRSGERTIAATLTFDLTSSLR